MSKTPQALNRLCEARAPSYGENATLQEDVFKLADKKADILVRLRAKQQAFARKVRQLLSAKSDQHPRNTARPDHDNHDELALGSHQTQSELPFGSQREFDNEEGEPFNHYSMTLKITLESLQQALGNIKQAEFERQLDVVADIWAQEIIDEAIKDVEGKYEDDKYLENQSVEFQDDDGLKETMGGKCLEPKLPTRRDVEDIEWNTSGIQRRFSAPTTSFDISGDKDTGRKSAAHTKLRHGSDVSELKSISETDSPPRRRASFHEMAKDLSKSIASATTDLGRNDESSTMHFVWQSDSVQPASQERHEQDVSSDDLKQDGCKDAKSCSFLSEANNVDEFASLLVREVFNELKIAYIDEGKQGTVEGLANRVACHIMNKVKSTFSSRQDVKECTIKMVGKTMDMAISQGGAHDVRHVERFACNFAISVVASAIQYCQRLAKQ